MDFIPASEVNKNKWDSLVQSVGKEANYFSCSYYLDAVAKNWGVVTDENHTKGFAFCYNEIFGIKIIYPPFLGRHIEFFNLSVDEISSALSKLKKDFLIADFNLELQLSSLTHPKSMVFQRIKTETPYSTLAKRMLKKARQNELKVVETDETAVLGIVYKELESKVKDFGKDNQKRLKDFISKIKDQNKLLSLGIIDKQQNLRGGLLFFQSEAKLIYITGACHTEARNYGGMYLAMDTAIQQALQENKTLDFGGSNIDSIRRFFCSLGGKDQHYYNYSWNQAPIWFKILRKIKKRF